MASRMTLHFRPSHAAADVSARSKHAPRFARRLRARAAAGLVLAALAGVLAVPQGVAAAAGDVGFQGPSTSNAGPSPTGSKPESKLWWNDGFWWASLWDVRSKDFHIFRLSQDRTSWIDTGVALDDRPSTRADVLWDGAAGKLYVASHRFSDTPASGYVSRLYRYSYNPTSDTYTRDKGFPVVINNYRLETLVIDKDSTGRLWATWAQGGKIWVNATICATTCNDATWGTAFSINGSNVKADDISSLIAFGGAHIGVMWSNQNNGSFSFAVHNDGDPDTSWNVETALSGTGMADDHINLKTDAAGRVYAAVKTSRTGANDPLIELLVRATDGSWSSAVFGRVADHHTRPMLLLDQEDGVIHMFATSSDSGGTILEKTSPMDSITFEQGPGTVVIQDADGLVNDATSLKRSVSPATGLVVAATSNQAAYFHMFETLGGTGPAKPIASFDTDVSSGTEPLTVHFTDTSSGTVDSWAWDFENDGTTDSTEQNPSHEYVAGTWHPTLTVTNTAGSDSFTATITVSPAGGGGPTQAFAPTDDAYVKSSAPNTTTGAATDLRVYKTSTLDTETYVRFTVGGTTGPVTSATLRLFVTDASTSSGDLYAVPDNSWTEGALTYATKPGLGALVEAAQAAPLGAWIDFDVTAAVNGDGTYSFALKDAPGTAYYSSKEGANPPQLVVTTGS
jgi:PKD repeat protein